MSNTMTNYQRADYEARLSHFGREDIRDRNDSELALIVANSETYYMVRNHVVLWDIINDRFTYTSEQLKQLENYIAAERNALDGKEY